MKEDGEAILAYHPAVMFSFMSVDAGAMDIDCIVDSRAARRHSNCCGNSRNHC